MNIIISVPFVRNIRHCLSIPFTSELKKYGKLIIVSPFKLSETDYTDARQAAFELHH